MEQVALSVQNPQYLWNMANTAKVTINCLSKATYDLVVGVKMYDR